MPMAEEPASGNLPDQSVSNSNQPHPRSNQEPYDMFFEDYGVNPSIDTEDDNLSTFALDVDTGSYTIMRNYLSEGNLPPADSVRVEEYVNYFDQDLPITSSGVRHCRWRACTHFCRASLSHAAREHSRLSGL
jgi:hypothetical protein